MVSGWIFGSASRRKAFGATVLLGLSASIMASGSAWAQSAGCADVQKFLQERKEISERIQKASKGKQIDAKTACSGFGQLVSNGTGLVKWIDANKDWCQIPEGFSENIKADHGRAVQIRGKACTVAAKQAQMEKQAREAGPAGGGLLGGPGLSGANKLPQGAL